MCLGASPHNPLTFIVMTAMETRHLWRGGAVDGNSGHIPVVRGLQLN